MVSTFVYAQGNKLSKKSSNAADIESGEITESLVANPKAASEVRRELPKVSGRDFSLFFSDRFRLMNGVKDEEFVRQAGWLVDTDLVRDGKFSCRTYRQEKPVRKTTISEIEIYQQDEDLNSAPKSKFSISSSEKTTFIDGIENLNDENKKTFAFVIGDPRDALKRYQGVPFEIKVVLPDDKPLSQVKVQTGYTGAYKLNDITFLGEDGDILKPSSYEIENGVVTAKFTNAPPSKILTFKCLSPISKISMVLAHPEIIDEFSKSPAPSLSRTAPCA